MHLIKLDAIDSTNSYLKALLKTNTCENMTVVQADEQLKGRGQIGTSWISEKGKNLTFSILIRIDGLDASQQFYLNMAVSLGLFVAVKEYVKSDLSIKWPNDILAGEDKVAGILIENVLHGSFIKQAIIGIGLNVNQEIFAKDLAKVSSIKNLTGQTIDREQLLEEIVQSIALFVVLIEKQQYAQLKALYLKQLYRFRALSDFKYSNGKAFSGTIKDISEAGQLLIEMQDASLKSFTFKEVIFS